VNSILFYLANPSYFPATGIDLFSSDRVPFWDTFPLGFLDPPAYFLHLLLSVFPFGRGGPIGLLFALFVEVLALGFSPVPRHFVRTDFLPMRTGG